MKKILYFITTILLTAGMLSLSSCLKDNYVDFTKSAPIVNFPLGGTQFFGADAITETPDSDANGTIVRQFAVNVGAPKTLSTATTVTLAIDNSIVTAYNASQTAVTYLTMPTNAFVFTATSVTVPAGKQYATVSVTFYKNKLDPAKSYMLPIKIVSAGGLNISGNQNIHYYHFIGNDLAGVYREAFSRWNATDSTSAALNALSYPFSAGITNVVLPITPTEIQVYTQYASPPPLLRYDITFTKTVTGGVASYTDLHLSFVPDDVAAADAGGITITSPPVFFNPATGQTLSADLPGPYTVAEVVKLLNFQFAVTSGGNPRYIKDKFAK
jgi:hypothetical protein